MTLDTLLAEHPPEPEKCRRHKWAVTVHWDDRLGNVADGTQHCLVCKVPRDPVRSRRGKSSRRLGGDQERRAERRYGWTKIGERGEKTDLRGRLFKVQQKSTRKAAPALIRDTFAGLDATRDGRVPLLLLTFVRQGIPAEDYVVIRGSDWLELHGRDEEDPTHG